MGVSRELRRSLAVVPLSPGQRYYGEGMGIVTGAPWHTQAQLQNGRKRCHLKDLLVS